VMHYDGAWNQFADLEAHVLRGVWGSGPTDIYAVGSATGEIGRNAYRYNGSNWGPVNIGTTVELHNVWGTSSSDVYVVGDGATVRHWDGTLWYDISPRAAAEFVNIWGNAPGSIYVVGATAAIHKGTRR